MSSITKEYEYTAEYAVWYLKHYKLNRIKCPFGFISNDTLNYLERQGIFLKEKTEKYRGKIYELTNEY